VLLHEQSKDEQLDDDVAAGGTDWRDSDTLCTKSNGNFHV
jgi:hypothetical protein